MKEWKTFNSWLHVFVSPPLVAVAILLLSVLFVCWGSRAFGHPHQASLGKMVKKAYWLL